MDFSNIDFAVFIVYAIIILSIGLYVSRQKNGKIKVQKIIFLQESHYHGGQ